MALSQNEYFCISCGFTIVVKGAYHPTCPICGEALGKRKPTSSGKTPRKNKKQSAKEK